MIICTYWKPPGKTGSRHDANCVVIVFMTTSGATNNYKVGTVTTLGFQCPIAFTGEQFWAFIWNTVSMATHSWQVHTYLHIFRYMHVWTYYVFDIAPKYDITAQPIVPVFHHAMGRLTNRYSNIAQWLPLQNTRPPVRSTQQYPGTAHPDLTGWGDLHSMRPGDAYMHHEPKPAVVQIMVCRLVGAKSLSEPVLEFFIGL